MPQDAPNPPAADMADAAEILFINLHSILNIGDQMIFHETLRVLEQATPHRRLTLCYNRIDDDTRALARKLNCEIVFSPLAHCLETPSAAHVRLAPQGRRIAFTLTFLLACVLYRVTGLRVNPFRGAERRKTLDAFQRRGAVIVNGGGYLYAGSAGHGIFGWFNLNALGCIAALVLGRPVVLLPQSIGPLQDDAQRDMIRWICRRAEAVFVREHTSLELLKALGCADRAHIEHDLAFGAQSGVASMQLTAAPGDRKVGVTLLNWQAQESAFGAQNSYETAMLAFIDELTAADAHVFLFTQCLGPSDSEDDSLVSRRVQAAAAHPARVSIVDNTLDPHALQALYAQTDYFFGTRMHSVIMALNAGVRAGAIGYLHKTSGIMREAGLDTLVCEIGTVTLDHLRELRAKIEAFDYDSARRYIAAAQASKDKVAAAIRAAVARSGARSS